jgi:hypothetical protein
MLLRGGHSCRKRPERRSQAGNSGVNRINGTI